MRRVALFNSLLIVLATALATESLAIPYMPGSGYQEIAFEPGYYSVNQEEWRLMNLEGPFTFTVTAAMEPELYLKDIRPGAEEVFEAFNYGVYMDIVTTDGNRWDLEPGDYSLTFRIQAWDNTPDIEAGGYPKGTYLAEFQVYTVPEPSTALLVALGLAGIASQRRMVSKPPASL